MKRFIPTLAIVATLFAGCSTQIVQTTDYMESQARVLEAEQSMLVTPIIADLKVSDTQIHYTETNAFANFEVTPALLQNITEFKEIALSHAARAYNADVLVGTTIDIVTKNKRLEITVSGYPAHYVKFRNANDKDVELQKELRKVRTEDGAKVVQNNSRAAKLDIQVNR